MGPYILLLLLLGCCPVQDLMKLSRVASSSAVACPDHHVHSLWKACLQGLEVLQAARALRVPFAVLIVVSGRPYRAI